MGGNQDHVEGVSRREVLKRTLQTGVYAAPAILALSAVAPVAAATPAPLVCVQPVTFSQDAVLFGAAASTTFDIYYTTNISGATKLGSITTDDLGLAFGSFSIAVDTSRVSTITLTAVLAGLPPTTPAATFPSTLVSQLTCQAGGPRGPFAFIGNVFQEPTAANCGGTAANQFRDVLDVGAFNGPANTSYDIYAQPNGGSAVKIGTFTTNPQGNVTIVAPVTVTTGGGASTSVVVFGAAVGSTTPVFSLTASGSTLTTLSCAGTKVSGGATSGPQLRAIT